MVVQQTKLRDVASVIRGVSFDKSDASHDFGPNLIPILRAGNISDSLDTNHDLVWVPESRVSKEQLLKERDIAICMSSGSREIVGKSALLDKPWTGSVGAFCAVIRTDPSACAPEYLAFFLKSSAFRTWTKASEGINIKNIRKSELENFSVPIPPIHEQRRIVDILKRADGIRRLRKQAIQTARELIPALFVDTFGDLATNSKGWEIVPVGSFVSGFEGGKNIKAAGDAEVAGAYRVLKVSAVTYGEYRPGESKPLAADYAPPSAHLVKKGDLLFSRANTEQLVGATAYVFDTPPNLLLPDKLWRFVWPNERFVEPLFVWALFQNRAIRAQMSKLATGTSGSMKNISQKKLFAMPVPLPPLDLQISFVERFMSLRSITQQQHSGELHSAQLFGSLLHRAFHGEL